MNKKETQGGKASYQALVSISLIKVFKKMRAIKIKKGIAALSIASLLVQTLVVGMYMFPSKNIARAENILRIETEKQAVSNECEKAEISLKITGKGDPIQERKPIDVVFVIDRSASMAGLYLANVKSAVKNFIDQMNFAGSDPDKVAVVSYAGYSSIPAQTNYDLGSNAALAKNAVDNISASGGTCIECGLKKAAEILGVSAREQFVILLSDGVANVKMPGNNNVNNVCYYAPGQSNCPSAATTCIDNAMAEGTDIKGLGVPVYSIGYRLSDISGPAPKCDNADATKNLAVQTLQNISSGPDYYYNGDPNDINQIFDSIAWKINNVAGYDAKIIEVLPDGISYVSGSAVPREPDEIDGQILTWNFGNLAIDESREVVFDVNVGSSGYSGLADAYPDTRVEYKNYQDVLYSVPFAETSIDIPSCTIPTPTPTPTPVPLCETLLPVPGDWAHYTEGWHQIVGEDAQRFGSDDVYSDSTFSLGQNNFVQCFCPPELGQGIQTDWIRTEEPIDDWYFLNGEQWNLGNFMYAAQNSSFDCQASSTSVPTPEPSATPTPSVEPTPSPSPEATEIEATPTPSVSPEPSVSPSPSVEPTVSPEVSPTPSPSTDPTPTPTPVSVSTSGGGGGMLIPELDITDEVKTITKDGYIKITWVTSHPATSRVIYDTVSGKFFSNSNSPTYGFDFIKEGDDSGVEKVIFHSVTLTDLVPGITYYYRAVSIGSLAISQEYSFVAPDPVIVTSPAPSPSPEPTLMPTVTPAPIMSTISESDPASGSASTPPLVLPKINTNQTPIVSANTETSIVDYLVSIGQPSDFDSRAVLAGENGISGYTGTAEQNIRLLSLLKNPVSQKPITKETTGAPEEEKNKALENSAVGDASVVSQKTANNEPPNNKEFQAGLAGVLGENSFISGIINGINQTAVVIIAVIAAIILAGKEYWMRMLKKVKN